VVVPKYGHTIVRRNQLKRRLREIGRLDVLPRLDTLPAGLDFLVRARREAYGVSFQRLRNQLVMLTEELL
jgi:ribonuclease P protein component